MKSGNGNFSSRVEKLEQAAPTRPVPTNTAVKAHLRWIWANTTPAEQIAYLRWCEHFIETGTRIRIAEVLKSVGTELTDRDLLLEFLDIAGVNLPANTPDPLGPASASELEFVDSLFSMIPDDIADLMLRGVH